uniref:Phage protein n=1 Tax=Escherichia coli TaxID=562 RepID=A0A890DIP1_ECOLX|nr:Phage protein [Escherichia coli]
MGYSAAKVSTHIELEKNRGYWRAKGLIVIVVNCHYRAVKRK